MRRYLNNLKTLIVIQLIFTTIYSITVAIFPLLNQYLFDYVLQDGISLVIKLLLLFLLLIAINACSQYISRIYEWKVAKKFFEDIKHDLFKHIISLKSNEFAKKKPSEYLSVFNNDVETIEEGYISPIIDIIKSVINLLIFSSAMIFFLDWRIALVLFTASLLTALIPKLFKEKLSVKRREHLLALQFYFGKVVDLLSGKNRIDSVTFAAFKEEHELSLRNSEEKRLQFGKYNTISNMLNAIGIYFIQIVIFALVGYLLVSQEITIGTGIATFGYLSSFLTPIQNILDCTNLIHSTKDTIKKTESYLNNDLLNEFEVGKYPVPVEKLTLNNISYDNGQFALAPINYCFNKGKKYAIIGHSGSGKSTLLKIIDGTIDDSNGHALINNQEISKEQLHQVIFSINQQEHLFQTNFLNNVTLFNSLKDDKRLTNELLEKLSNVTKKKITSYEKVDQLSGGEKQIIGLLRMLAANRDIILMDESFSNIDKENSNLIHDFLFSLKDKMIIEVTHDISEENLSKYDHILAFNNGSFNVVK